MGRKSTDDEPSLAEAWTMLGERLGLSVESLGERSMRARGTVRGRPVMVEIEGDKAPSEFVRFFLGVSTMGSRTRREKWRSLVTVGVANPQRVTGTIESFVDANDPAWKPGEFNPRNGRRARADSPALASLVLNESIHERLMEIFDDVTIEVQPQQLRFEHHNKARPGRGANYVAGSVLHHFRDKPPPWPERALVGPPRWIELLCDMADAVDRRV